MDSPAGKLVVGALEKCDLPDLGISNLVMRVDTGAATSSLHVENVEEYEKGGKSWISFDIHPDVYNVAKITRHSSVVKARRKVRSSSETLEHRYVIATTLAIGEHKWPIRINLTDRTEMTYLMLLGRQAMADKILVDPSQEFLVSDS
jgi:hypothetical protein